MKRFQLLSAAGSTCIHKLGLHTLHKGKGGLEHTASANEHVTVFLNCLGSFSETLLLIFVFTIHTRHLTAV